MRPPVAIILSFLVWCCLVISVFMLYEYLSVPNVARGDRESIQTEITERMAAAAREGRVGCAAVVFVDSGMVSLARCYGAPNGESECDPDKSLFTVASVSKAATALGAMWLSEKGIIGLDEPLIRFMTRWKFPGTPDSLRNEVTMRHLLSHTSGIVDGFGTGGSALDSPMQSLPDYLTFPMHTNMGTPHATVVSARPGSGFAYSTMGYAVVQLAIEDALGIPFNTFMTDSIFAPLGITHSSYDVVEIMSRGDAEDLVANYDNALVPESQKIRRQGRRFAKINGFRIWKTDFRIHLQSADRR